MMKMVASDKGKFSSTTSKVNVGISSINKVESLFEDHSTMLYLNFAKDVEEITDILRRMDILEDIQDR